MPCFCLKFENRLLDFLCTADKQSFCKYEADLMSLINNINIRILRWLHVNVNDIEWEKPNGIRDGSFHVNSCYTAPTDGKHVLDENMFWEKNDLRINITTFDLYSAWKIRQQAFSTVCHCGNILQCKRGFKHFVHFFFLFSLSIIVWKLVFNFICKRMLQKNEQLYILHVFEEI